MIVNANTVRVDGVVDGDLIVLLAERLILRGEVKGNVFSSARTIEVSGSAIHEIDVTVIEDRKSVAHKNKFGKPYSDKYD